MKGNKIFEPPRYMKTHEAAQQLLDIIERVSNLNQRSLDTADGICKLCFFIEYCHKISKSLPFATLQFINFSVSQYFQRNTGADGEMSRETQCVAIARVGAKDQKMASGTLEELAKVDLGAPLHCFIVTGKLHPMEEEFLAKLVSQES